MRLGPQLALMAGSSDTPPGARLQWASQRHGPSAWDSPVFEKHEGFLMALS